MTEFTFRSRRTVRSGRQAESQAGAPPIRRRRLPWPLRFVKWLAISFSDLIRFLLYTALFFALIGAVSYWLVVSYVKRNDEIAAPDLRRLTVYEAIDKVHSDRISLQLDHKQPHPSIPEGRIISQFPPPDQTIKAGTPIRVVVSSGTSLIPVPDVMVGETRRAAGLRLRAAGLDEGNITTIARAGVAGGIVLATDPPSRAGVPEGSKVNLLISSGEATAALEHMPNLIGLNAEQAGELIAPFKAEVRVEAKPGSPPGLIHTQSPAPGESVGPQTRIVITSSPAEAGQAPPREVPAVQVN
ncbi:MAG: PASTA domain-containing protein [Candidatus Sumerlaeia bacterium]